jgi:hypothetical protein
LDSSFWPLRAKDLLTATVIEVFWEDATMRLVASNLSFVYILGLE